MENSKIFTVGVSVKWQKNKQTICFDTKRAMAPKKIITAATAALSLFST